jgi:AraC-like DNA-binding protein
LNERDTVRVKDEKPRGILHLRAKDRLAGLTRYWPSPDLAPFVEHYWIVRWDLEAPRLAETVPHPSIHIALDTTGGADVVGVMRIRFSRLLQGRGRVVGTKFRPGAFRPFVRAPVSDFTDQRKPLCEVFGTRASGLRDRVLRQDDDRASIEVVESFLRGLQPEKDGAMLLAGRVAARIADDRRVTRVDQLVREFSVSLRQLQRLFSEYVGVSPKWVIQRYRLLDAAERVAAGTPVSWSALALDLGYADQAHFIRDFKKLVGRSPADYARSLASSSGSPPS